MSISLGGGSKTTKTTTDPWKPAQPYLKSFLGDLNTAGAGLGTLTPGQTQAFGQLSANASQAGQFTPDIEALTRDLFGTQSTSPMATAAYSRLQGQLGDYANGANLDPMSDPHMRTLLDTVGSDAANRINSMFAGAGRDLSPENSQALSRGITQAEAPILVGQYNTNVGRQFDAANSLYGAGVGTATAVSNLDAQANAQRQQGIQTAQAALDSLNLPANIRLQIEEQMKSLPVQELSQVAQMLFQAAGLGGTSTQNTSGFQAGISLKYPSTA